MVPFLSNFVFIPLPSITIEIRFFMCYYNFVPLFVLTHRDTVMHMKKRLFLIPLVVFLLVSLIILLVLPRNPVQRMHYRIINYWGIPNSERIVDLNSGEIWIFDSSRDPETNEYLTRDKNAENQGYTLLCELTPAQIWRLQVVFHLCGVQN